MHESGRYRLPAGKSLKIPLQCRKCLFFIDFLSTYRACRGGVRRACTGLRSLFCTKKFNVCTVVRGRLHRIQTPLARRNSSFAPGSGVVCRGVEPFLHDQIPRLHRCQEASAQGSGPLCTVKFHVCTVRRGSVHNRKRLRINVQTDILTSAYGKTTCANVFSVLCMGARPAGMTWIRGCMACLSTLPKITFPSDRCRRVPLMI
jgi:hypothetical protein